MIRAHVGKRTGTPWTRDDLLEAGRRLGRKPTLADVIPSQKAVYRIFGSLRAFQVALGYEPNGRGMPKGARIRKRRNGA